MTHYIHVLSVTKWQIKWGIFSCSQLKSNVPKITLPSTRKKLFCYHERVLISNYSLQIPSVIYNVNIWEIYLLMITLYIINNVFNVIFNVLVQMTFFCDWYQVDYPQTHSNNSSANCRRILCVCLSILWNWR